MLASLKRRAAALRRHTLTAYFAARDPRTPLAVRLLAMAVAAYALSPIDLVPDVVPVLGLLDDLLIVPLGLALVVRLVPPEVRAHAEARAREASAKPVSRVAAAVVVTLWAGAAWLLVRHVLRP